MQENLNNIMETEYQYMVDFTLPEVLSEEFMSLIPEQRVVVGGFFTEGKLANYMLALDDGKLWAIFNAKSEFEVMNMVAELPLTPYMEVKISLLTFNNMANELMPSFSLN